MRRRPSLCDTTAAEELTLGVLLACIPEILPLIINECIVYEGSSYPCIFHTLYSVLTRVCRSWHTIVQSITHLDATTYLFVRCILTPVPELGSCSYNNVVWVCLGDLTMPDYLSRRVHTIVDTTFRTMSTTLKPFLCLNGSLCPRVGSLMNYHIPDILSSLYAQTTSRPTETEMFVLVRAMAQYGALMMRNHRRDRVCSKCPPRAAKLDELYVRVGYADHIIMVPLWELRDKLRAGKKGCTVTMTTPYSMLRYDAQQLMPVPYRRGNLLASSESDGDRVDRERSFYSLSVERRVDLLQARGDEIVRDIMNPSRVLRRNVDKKKFIDGLDRVNPMLEVSGQLLYATILKLYNAWRQTTDQEAHYMLRLSDERVACLRCCSNV